MTTTDKLLILFGALVIIIALVVAFAFLVEKRDPNFYVAPEDET